MRGIQKSFGGRPVVRDVSLDLGAGEFISLLGPSGCGKTTLLRLMAGFEAPDAGSIELDGRDMTRLPPHRRPLNMMFQSYALFPHLTVGANVGYGLRMSGVGRAERTARVAEMLRLVRLEEHAERYPAQLSGGQRQRVALARALAKGPRVLLLDEPMAALDRSLREETQAELKALQRRLGTTFVVVTHDQGEAMAMSDRIAVMNAGALVQVGSPREIYERPDNRFVARFVGDANLLEGRALAWADGRVRVALDGGHEVEAAFARPPEFGQRVALAIRPERMRLGTSQSALINSLPGRLLDVAYGGATLSCRVALAAGQTIRLVLPSAEVDLAALERSNGAVTAGFSPEAAVVLS